MKMRALLLMLFLATSARAATCVVPFAQYVDALTRIRATLDTPQAAAARDEARNLAACEVDSPAGRFAADAPLLDAIANGNADKARLTATIDALRRARPQPLAARVDPKLVEKLRAAETPRELRAGGEVGNVPMSDDPRLETVAQKMMKFFRWIWQKINDLWDWILSWWPTSSRAKTNGAFVATPWLVGFVVIVIVGLLAVLALEVARRSKRRVAAPIATSDPVASKRDEDPLSRGANEWERYAAQLAAAGRFREAIRATYHSVLVTLYGGAILHFRKGRTNWEYIATLSPDLGWRGEFIELTRRFESEWYGHDESDLDAFDECAASAKRIIEDVRRARGVAA